MTELMKIIAVLFLYREKIADGAKAYGAAIAYANAFNLLMYGLIDCVDCVSQFEGYEQAVEFIKAHPDADFWELEDIFKGWA